jgi:hypothetical protein
MVKLTSNSSIPYKLLIPTGLQNNSIPKIRLEHPRQALHRFRPEHSKVAVLVLVPESILCDVLVQDYFFTGPRKLWTSAWTGTGENRSHWFDGRGDDFVAGGT